MTRALLSLGRKVRAPLWIFANLARASFDGDVARFADRHKASPLRRFGWRCLLTFFALLLYAGIVFVNAVISAALLTVPPVLITWGNLQAIWEGSET